MNERLVRISRFLSYILRHHPEEEGLSMDEHGWVRVHELLAAPGARRRHVTDFCLREIVEDNDKQRFEFSEDGLRIRARQGHSRPVESDWKEVPPPDRLYHGTAAHHLPSIRREGLQKRGRHHVHLSPDAATARGVGARHGSPAVLAIRAGDMRDAGHAFYLSGNGVWLTETVPPEFIDFP